MGQAVLEASEVILGSCFLYFSFIFCWTTMDHLVGILAIHLNIGSLRLLPFWTPSTLAFLNATTATRALELGLALLGVLTNTKILLLPAQIRNFLNVYSVLTLDGRSCPQQRPSSRTSIKRKKLLQHQMV